MSPINPVELHITSDQVWTSYLQASEQKEKQKFVTKYNCVSLQVGYDNFFDWRCMPE